MHLAGAVVVVLFVMQAGCAQFVIQQVGNVVENVLQGYGNTVESSVNETENTQAAPYWYETIAHQGISAFGPAGYHVFRNVKDYGAKGILWPLVYSFSKSNHNTGDGVTDDTAAINAAIAYGNRCANNCGSSSVKGALIYFPPGTKFPFRFLLMSLSN